jgi:glutathione S-transferase
VICEVRARRHDLSPHQGHARLRARQLTFALEDLVSDIEALEDTPPAEMYRPDRHDPARAFARERLPDFLLYFEGELRRADARYLLGARLSYVDLGLFHVLEGLAHAFPGALTRQAHAIPSLLALRARVRERDRIAAYLDSRRRAPFGLDGIFHYDPRRDTLLDA